MKTHLANTHTKEMNLMKYILAECGHYIWNEFVTLDKDKATCKRCLSGKRPEPVK